MIYLKNISLRIILLCFMLALVTQLSGCSRGLEKNGDSSGNTYADADITQQQEEPSDLSQESEESKIKNSIRDYLLLKYSEEDIFSISVSSKKVEVKIQTDILDECPDNWVEIKDSVCSDCDKINELASDYSSNTIMYLLNANSSFALTVLNGRVSYDMFEEKNISDNLPTISLLEFNSITIGMSYSEVCRIVGSSGTVDYEYDSGLFNMISYNWDGESEFSFASITFTDGEVSSKIQVGLT